MNNTTCIVPEKRSTDGLATRRRSLLICAGLGLILLGILWWFDPAEIKVPLCTFHAMTGLDCPGCGATRATHELLHGQLLAALRYNALWVILSPVAVYLAISELRALTVGRPLPGDLARQTWFWIGITLLAAIFFVLRNLP